MNKITEIRKLAAEKAIAAVQTEIPQDKIQQRKALSTAYGMINKEIASEKLK